MTANQTTVLIIGSIITAFPLLLLLFRIPGPLYAIGIFLKEISHGPTNTFKFFAWLTNGWKLSRWDAIKVPLFATLICAILTALAVLIIR